MFIILNRLFHLISHLKISSYIHIFSFWLYSLFLVVFQNWQQLLVLSLTNLFNIFSFDISTKIIQLLSLIMISMIVILCVCLFPMLFYFYKKKSMYFLSNICFSKYSWAIMELQFVLFPGIEATIHICLTEHPGIQKIMLFTSGMLFILTNFFFYMKLDIFISQGSFWIEIILRSFLCILNLVLYFRFEHFEDSQTTKALEILIEVLLNCFIYFLIFEVVYPMLHLIGSKVIVK